MTTFPTVCPPGKDFIKTKREERCNRCFGDGIALRSGATCWRCKGTGRMNRVIRIWNEALSFEERHRIELQEKEARLKRRNPRIGLERVYEATPGLREAFAKCGDDPFINSVKAQASKKGRLSGKQIRAVFSAAENTEKMNERRAVWAEESKHAYPAPTYRCTRTFVVVHIRDGQKMLVKHDSGWKAWGSVPKAIRNVIKVGCRISLRATFKATDDPTFAYMNRPSNAVLYRTAESEAFYSGVHTKIAAEPKRPKAPAAEVEVVLAVTIEDAVRDIDTLPSKFRLAVDLGLMTYADAVRAAAQAAAAR